MKKISGILLLLLMSFLLTSSVSAYGVTPYNGNIIAELTENKIINQEEVVGNIMLPGETLTEFISVDMSQKNNLEYFLFSNNIILNNRKRTWKYKTEIHIRSPAYLKKAA